MTTVLDHLPAPQLAGPADAGVTLVGWGSTWGVISEAVERLNAEASRQSSADQVLGTASYAGDRRHAREEPAHDHRRK